MPVGIIATPNEMSYDSGYLGLDNFGLEELVDHAMMGCDHGNDLPFLGRDHGNDLPSLVRDLPYYDIMHVEDMANVQEYIDVLCAANRVSVFEVGQEERKVPYLAPRIYWLLHDMREHMGDEFRRIVYAVVQSGMSLDGDVCVGEFDEERLRAMCGVCHSYGVLAKMHNADFMFSDLLRKHTDCGVDSFNVGPELAAIEAGIYIREGVEWGGTPSDLRYDFEANGIREKYEAKCGEEIRAAIRTSIVSKLEAIG